MKNDENNLDHVRIVNNETPEIVKRKSHQEHVRTTSNESPANEKWRQGTSRTC